MVYEIGKMPIIVLVGYFALYLALHVAIGIFSKKLVKKYENDKNPETKKSSDIFMFLFKWFPAFYIVFLLIMFYLG